MWPVGRMLPPPELKIRDLQTLIIIKTVYQVILVYECRLSVVVEEPAEDVELVVVDDGRGPGRMWRTFAFRINRPPSSLETIVQARQEFRSFFTLKKPFSRTFTVLCCVCISSVITFKI